MIEKIPSKMFHPMCSKWYWCVNATAEDSTILSASLTNLISTDTYTFCWSKNVDAFSLLPEMANLGAETAKARKLPPKSTEERDGHLLLACGWKTCSYCTKMRVALEYLKMAVGNQNMGGMPQQQYANITKWIPWSPTHSHSANGAEKTSCPVGPPYSPNTPLWHVNLLLNLQCKTLGQLTRIK